MAKKKHRKSNKPKISPRKKEYLKEWGKVQEKVKKLRAEGYQIDEQDLPKFVERPNKRSIAKLKEDYSMFKLRTKAYVTLESGEKVTSRDVESIKRKGRAEIRREEREEKKRTARYDYEYEEPHERRDEEPPRLPTEIDSALDSLYDLLDPYYYEKDRTHTSSFTREAQGIMGDIREHIDSLREEIEDGLIDPQVLAEYIEDIKDIIYDLTRDYKVVEEEYDIKMSELMGILGTISYESRDYYDYHSSSEDDE